jgi:predicted O-methyltransferase YrrM
MSVPDGDFRVMENPISWPERAVSLMPEYLLMDDVNPSYMSGNGYLREWTNIIYGQSAEMELLDTLYALVRLVKPELVVEGGCHLGLGSYALGRALQDNGHGHCITSDVSEIFVETTKNRVKDLPVEVRHCSLMDLPLEFADFAFLDSSYETRLEGAKKLKKGALGIVHDVRQSPELAKGLTGVRHINVLSTWRGFAFIQG